MRKNYKKILVFAMVLSMAFGVTAFAAEPIAPTALMTQVREATFNPASFYKTFTDDAGLLHEINGTSTGSCKIEWTEGIDGWVVKNTANFSVSSATDTLYEKDGNRSTVPLNVSRKGDTVYVGSAYQEFVMAGYTLRSVISCDAYGQAWFSTGFIN